MHQVKKNLQSQNGLSHDVRRLMTLAWTVTGLCFSRKVGLLGRAEVFTKTNLRRYYEHDWAEMQRILKRNQRKLPNVDLDMDAYRNEPAQKIRQAWETSMETLRPLLKDIEATDRLIDRIIYQLYGLTDEEVAILEGSAS